MKKAVVALVFLALFATGTYFGLHQYQKQNIITRCETRQTETGLFLDTVRAKDSSRCTSLSSPLRERCLAFINDDPSSCKQDDPDCKAIASHNAALCAEPLCRAMASGNENECDALTDSADWCKRTMRFESTPVDTNTCQEIADTIN